MPDETAAPATTAVGSSEGSLADRLAADLAMLDRELGEIDLLVAQAKAEAARHEGRRSTASDKLDALATAGGDPTERLELAANLITLTKRAALMESQVDVLEGKRRALARYRDAVTHYGGRLVGGSDAGGSLLAMDGDQPMPPEVSRLLLTAQEDLRREIARAMHDGPAQSLTNIVLQAQIVERLVEQDPSMAAGEVRQLIAMVQGTLDATKSFIFDVRPMVLDDLGLVPTIRRAVRERGQRAGIVVDFESLGQDRRLPMDLESGLFRILDEALAAYLAARPEQVTLRLDWGEQLTATVSASRPVAAIQRAPGALTPVATDARATELPPALAAMMQDRLSDERDARETAEREAIVVLPATTWREIQSRAGSLGVHAELLGDGGELRVVADLPSAEPPGA